MGLSSDSKAGLAGKFLGGIAQKTATPILIAFAVMFTARVFGFIDWSWWLVTLPLWFWPAFILSIVLLLLIVPFIYLLVKWGISALAQAIRGYTRLFERVTKRMSKKSRDRRMAAYRKKLEDARELRRSEANE